jgi:hypothetical protein
MAIFLQPSFWKKIFNFNNRKNWLNLDQHILDVVSEGSSTVPTVTPATDSSTLIANTEFVQDAILAAGSFTTVKFTLTGAQLVALNTTPVVVSNIPNPGPGKGVRVVALSFKYNYLNGPYAMNSGAIAILPTTKASSTPSTTISQYVINFSAIGGVSVVSAGLGVNALTSGSGFFSGEYQALVENDTLSFKSSGAITNPGSASGTLSCYITYTVITF